MRVVHLVSTFPPYKGGMGNVCLAQAKNLASFGHQVSVYTPLETSLEILETRSPKKWILETRSPKSRSPKSISDAGFAVRYLKPLFKYGNAAFVPGIIKSLKNFDLIHLHWPFLGGSEILLLWRLFRKKPKLIVQYHMDLIAPGLRGLIFKLNFFLFAPLMVKLADKILVSSQDYLEHSDLKRHWLKNKEKFIISPFGVDQQRFFPQEKKGELLEQYGLKNKKIILSVGGLDRAHYFKGVRLLIMALTELKDKMPDLYLLLVGEGNLRPEYEKLASDLGIKKRVIFSGRVEDNQLPDYYNLSDVFVFPSFSRSEAFGLVSLEAMACAKPVILSDLPGVRTLAKDNGLISKVNDIDDLREKIISIFSCSEKLKAMGENGLRMVKGKYHWPSIVKEIEKIYVQAVAS